MADPKDTRARAVALATYALDAREVPHTPNFDLTSPTLTARSLAAPDLPALRALVGALMCAGPQAAAAGWRRDEAGAQIVRRVGFESVRVRLHAAGADAAWREVSAISPLALDVLALVVDRFSDGGGVRLIRCGEILAAKGFRRYGVERSALEAQLGRELVRLGQITIGIEEQPLFAVARLSGSPYSFVVSLDPAVRDAWVAAPVRELGHRLVQFDHRLNRGSDVLAKKLGLYFSLAGAGSRPVVRKVGSVLSAVGAAPERWTCARSGRLADRVEEAMLRLQEAGLFAVTLRGPRGGDVDEPRLKGWISRWLASELVVERAA